MPAEGLLPIEAATPLRLVDKEEVAYGVTIAHMIHWHHAANFAINGYYALKHLIAAHRTDDED